MSQNKDKLVLFLADENVPPSKLLPRGSTQREPVYSKVFKVARCLLSVSEMEFKKFTQITQNEFTNLGFPLCKIDVVDITPILAQLYCHLFCMHFLSSPFACSAAKLHLTHGVRMGS